MTHSGYLIVDIETVPDTSLWSPPIDKPDAFPPPYAHRVVCIGMFSMAFNYMPAGVPVAFSADALFDDDERDLLLSFSKTVAARRPTLVTYNGRRFDLPVVAMRSLHHAVPLPWYYKNRDARYRFSEEGHLDLADALTDYGACTTPTLDAAARLIGLPGKGAVNGAQVETLYRESQFERIRSYCLSDVMQTALLFLRFRLVQGAIDQETHRAMCMHVRRAFESVDGPPAIMPAPSGANDPAPGGALPDTATFRD